MAIKHCIEKKGERVSLERGLLLLQFNAFWLWIWTVVGIFTGLWRAHAQSIPLKMEPTHQAVCVHRYRLAFTIKGSFKLPSDVAIGPMGWIYVLDGTQNRVSVFNAKGTPLFTLGGGRRLNQPLGLSVSDTGQVVVADSGSHRVAIFPPGVNEPHYIDVPSPPGGRPADPTDAVFSRDGQSIIVIDNDNHRVISLDCNGNVKWVTGEMGRSPGEFRFPFLMDIDEKGLLYIVEVINTRIQVLDQRGRYIRFIGKWGIDPGQFYRPKGVAVDKDGRVFVSDSYVGVVQIFSTEGDFLGVVGRPNGEIWHFDTPVGIAIRGNELFVVEMIQNRVLVLKAMK